MKRFQALASFPDWVLVRQAKLGEKEAFGKLYEKYLDRLYRYIFYRTGQRVELTEDLVQTVFLKAWEKLDSFQKGSFQAWLYMIARNTWIDHMRVRKQHVQLDETVQDTKEQVEEKVLQTIQYEHIMQALQFLTDEQQEIILLRFVNDLSYKEIAQALGKKEDAIRATQYRALKELKRRLTDDR